MEKDKKSILGTPSDKIMDVLENLNARVLHLEGNARLHTKMLNANLLRLAALIDILIENKIVDDEQIENTAKEILDKVKQHNLEYKDEYESVKQKFENFDSIGHA